MCAGIYEKLVEDPSSFSQIRQAVYFVELFIL